MTTADKLIRAKTDYDKVYEAGKKAEYDAFWDAAQQNGNRASYEGAFTFGGWSDNFYPKYNMKPTTATQMFYQFDANGFASSAMDLVARLNDCGVVLDLSKATSINYCFQNARISHVGIIDVTGCSNINSVFANAYWMRTIDKFVVKESTTYNDYVFQNATDLRNITIEGVIGNTISFKWSPLTKESITSVINALSSSTSGKTATFKKTAKEEAFTADEWAALIATKPNWTISLA